MKSVKELFFHLALTGILAGVAYNIFSWGEPFNLVYTFGAFMIGMIFRMLLDIIFIDWTSEKSDKTNRNT